MRPRHDHTEYGDHIYEVTSITVDGREIDFAQTGSDQPDWADAGATDPEEWTGSGITTVITYGSPVADDTSTWVEDGDDEDAFCIWTYVGVAAEWTPSNRVHSLAAGGAGQLVKAMDDTDQTLSVAEASSLIIKATGTLTGDKDLRFPAPADDEGAYQRTIRAAVTGGDLKIDVVGGSAPVILAPGETAIVGFDAGGAFSVTAAV